MEAKVCRLAGKVAVDLGQRTHPSLVHQNSRRDIQEVVPAGPLDRPALAQKLARLKDLLPDNPSVRHMLAQAVEVLQRIPQPVRMIHAHAVQHAAPQPAQSAEHASPRRRARAPCAGRSAYSHRRTAGIPAAGPPSSSTPAGSSAGSGDRPARRGSRSGLRDRPVDRLACRGLLRAQPLQYPPQHCFVAMPRHHRAPVRSLGDRQPPERRRKKAQRIGPARTPPPDSAIAGSEFGVTGRI